MMKLLAGTSIVTLLAIAPALAQTTTTPSTTPPAATQDNSKGMTTTQPSAKQPSATTTDTMDKSATTGMDKTAEMTLTEEQAKSWVDKPVYSSDGKEVGEVVGFERGADNKVMEMHADIGGLMGLGETRVKVAPAQFKLQGDRAVLTMTEAEAKKLPKVTK